MSDEISSNTNKVYFYLTAQLQFQAPWHPRNWDKGALRSRLNNIPGITVKNIALDEKEYAFWNYKPKRAHVWAELNGKYSKPELRSKIDKAADTNAVAFVSVENLRFGVSVDETPEDGNAGWKNWALLIGGGALGFAVITEFFE